MNDYTLYYMAKYKQRDVMQERDQDRLARQVEAENNAQETQENKRRQSLQELIVSYLLPKNTASRVR
ncbi:MAG: hypothetical protein KJ064_27610 [Anaerolineae bacterium]|nr:MAG: hypothetical protein F9K27_16810 [Anaerolineae bacterium]MCL4880450.1 hypothetical protein [Anaerolineae bacterium]